MEGYLSLLHKKKFTKFWFVLDGQQLTYYERLDLIQQLPVRVQGTIQLKDATVKAVVHDSRRYVIRITSQPPSSSSSGGLMGLQSQPQTDEYLDCERGEDQSVWFQCLLRASELHRGENGGAGSQNRAEAIQRYAAVLGIEPGAPISLNSIARTYRRLCLKAHPDKGGDITKFNEINIAYNKLLALQAEAEARQLYEEIEYEALIEKGADKVGLGLIVSEDQVRARIVVTQVNDSILLRGLSEGAGGAIQPGDCLVAIDKDDCTTWPMSRIKARLNNFRLPVGMATRMRFSRRIKDASAEEELLKSPVASPAVSPKNTAPPTPERLERRLDVDESFAAAAASAPDDQNSDEKNNSDASPVDCATTPRSPPTDDAESKRPPKEHSTPKISVYLEDDDDLSPQASGPSPAEDVVAGAAPYTPDRVPEPRSNNWNVSSSQKNSSEYSSRSVCQELVVELQMTKLKLFEAEAAASSWKERSDALEDEIKGYKRRVFESEEKAIKLKQLVDSQARDVQTLRQKLENLMNVVKEASIYADSTSSQGPLELHLRQVQRSTVDEFTALSDFNRKIQAQLDELRCYCGAASNNGQVSEGEDARKARGRRYRETEERARKLEKHVLSLV